jgi:hypothetical protein
VVERLLSISGWRTPEGRWRRVELTVVPASEVRPWRFPPRFDLQYGDWLRSAFERGEVEPWPTNENPDLAVLLTVVLLAGRPVLGPPPAEVLDPWRTRISSAPWSTASTPARGPRRGHAQRRPHARADLEHRCDGGDPLEGRRGRVGAPAASRGAPGRPLARPDDLPRRPGGAVARPRGPCPRPRGPRRARDQPLVPSVTRFIAGRRARRPPGLPYSPRCRLRPGGRRLMSTRNRAQRARTAAVPRTGLACLECGARADDRAHGWQAFLADGIEFPRPQVLVYCPSCADREFGAGASRPSTPSR